MCYIKLYTHHIPKCNFAFMCAYAPGVCAHFNLSVSLLSRSHNFTVQNKSCSYKGKPDTTCISNFTGFTGMISQADNWDLGIKFIISNESQLVMLWSSWHSFFPPTSAKLGPETLVLGLHVRKLQMLTPTVPLLHFQPWSSLPAGIQ